MRLDNEAATTHLSTESVCPNNYAQNSGVYCTLFPLSYIDSGLQNVCKNKHEPFPEETIITVLLLFFFVFFFDNSHAKLYSHFMLVYPSSETIRCGLWTTLTYDRRVTE